MRADRFCVVIALANIWGSAVVQAARHPRFEPTDLEFADSGTLGFDLQVGLVRGPDASRIVVPDFELNVGLLSWLELDVDGALGIEGHRPGPAFFDHASRDNLWLSAKLGLWDSRDPVTHHAWAFGIQAGPKIPIATDTEGLGFEALMLFGRAQGSQHLVAQVGALVDPFVGATPRPWGIEGGVDLEVLLDGRERWSLLGEIGAIVYGSSDDSQLVATAGIQYSATPMFDVSLVALIGVLEGSDRYGLLLGVSPQISLW